MRGLVFAALVALGAAAYACDSFEGASASSTSEPDGAAGDVPSDVVDSAVTSDAVAADTAKPCEGEPAWVQSNGVTTATCDGIANIDLLTSQAHCGRCNHSCAPDTCVAGRCAVRDEDVGRWSRILATDGTAIYYVRGVLDAKPEIVRLVPGSTPVVIAQMDDDAGNEDPIAAGVGPTDLWIRTQHTLRRTQYQVASVAPPEAVVSSLNYVERNSVAVFDGKVLFTQSNQNVIRAFDPADGGVSEPIKPAPSAVEARATNGRFVWLSQPWAMGFLGSPSDGGRVNVHEANGTNRVLLDTADDIGGLAVDGDQAFMIRRGDAGALMRLDLVDGAAETVHADTFTNEAARTATALDATHVYWLKATEQRDVTEVWKRARCGGSAVPIAKSYGIYELFVVGGRVYVSGLAGVFSLAK